MRLNALIITLIFASCEMLEYNAHVSTQRIIRFQIIFKAIRPQIIRFQTIRSQTIRSQTIRSQTILKAIRFQIIRL